mmetsp:Transcript_22051/g.39675  ORF Transcript_22051/g.39675 Transcript_22051/m.39675 type:complete len:289 (-) Transcript_22051:70-936(-)
MGKFVIQFFDVPIATYHLFHLTFTLIALTQDVQYSDADDLVFLVAPAVASPSESFMPSSTPSDTPSALTMRPSSLDPTPSPEVSDFYFVCASNFIDALTHCMDNPPCPTGRGCDAGDMDMCFPIHCTDCPEIDCYPPTSSPTRQKKPPSESPSAEPSQSQSSIVVSDFLFVCAANFIDALTHCTDNPLCPTGTECVGGNMCFPIHCTDCPEIPCYPPTSSPTRQSNPPSISISPSTKPTQSPSTKYPTTSPMHINSTAPSVTSSFRFVCAANFVDALTNCTNNPPSPR